MNVVQPIRDADKVHEIEERLAANKHTPRGWRVYMLFELGIYTGLRISDMVRLRVDDLRGQTHITMRERKTGKGTTLPLGKAIRKVIRAELADKDGGAYVFASPLKTRPTKKNPGAIAGREKPMDRKTAYNYMTEIKKAAGLPYNVGCHTLRKTFGYHFYKRTKSIGDLTIWFNHSSEEITKRYIGIDLDELTKAAEDFKI